jgi:MarR family transcriptional regulator, organic hydroperoxide resistance regulator
MPTAPRSQPRVARAKKDLPVPFSAGIGYAVRHTHKALSRRLAYELAQAGISFGHYYYLRALFEANGISQMELSERVGVDPTTVVTVVDTLERANVVERRKDPTDRRKALIYLTPKGRKLRRPLLAAIAAAQANALVGISAADIETFRRVALRVIDNLNNDAPDDAPQPRVFASHAASSPYLRKRRVG